LLIWTSEVFVSVHGKLYNEGQARNGELDQIRDMSDDLT